MNTRMSPVGIPEILSAFESSGWEHLGTSVLDSTDSHKKYKHQTWVRVTTMFFRVPGKALVIRMDLSECTGSFGERSSLEAHLVIGVTPDTPCSSHWETCVPNGIEDRFDGPGAWHTGGRGCNSDWVEHGQDDVRWDLSKRIRFTSRDRDIVPTLAAVMHLIKLVEEHFVQYARDGKLNYLTSIGRHVPPAEFIYLTDGKAGDLELRNQEHFWAQLDPSRLLTANEVLYANM